VQITELLQRVHRGESNALDAVVPLIYGELKKLAAGHLRRESGVRALDTTALVHEAFLRLAGGRHPLYGSRSHFFGVASRIMRQVLVDLARAQACDKRKGMEITLAGTPGAAAQPEAGLLALDDALNRLAEEDPLKAQLIEMKFFGGMTAEESAAVLSLSIHIVRRHLRLAQAWLRKELE
jgi:RNA polymerase sigma factor (TIGR02999 family)